MSKTLRIILLLGLLVLTVLPAAAQGSVPGGTIFEFPTSDAYFLLPEGFSAREGENNRNLIIVEGPSMELQFTDADFVDRTSAGEGADVRRVITNYFSRLIINYTGEFTAGNIQDVVIDGRTAARYDFFDNEDYFNIYIAIEMASGRSGAVWAYSRTELDEELVLALVASFNDGPRTAGPSATPTSSSPLAGLIGGSGTPTPGAVVVADDPRLGAVHFFTTSDTSFAHPADWEVEEDDLGGDLVFLRGPNITVHFTDGVFLSSAGIDMDDDGPRDVVIRYFSRLVLEYADTFEEDNIQEVEIGGRPAARYDFFDNDSYNNTYIVMSFDNGTMGGMWSYSQRPLDEDLILAMAASFNTGRTGGPVVAGDTVHTFASGAGFSYPAADWTLDTSNADFVLLSGSAARIRVYDFAPFAALAFTGRENLLDPMKRYFISLFTETAVVFNAANVVEQTLSDGRETARYSDFDSNGAEYVVHFVRFSNNTYGVVHVIASSGALTAADSAAAAAIAASLDNE